MSCIDSLDTVLFTFHNLVFTSYMTGSELTNLFSFKPIIHNLPEASTDLDYTFVFRFMTRCKGSRSGNVKHVYELELGQTFCTVLFYMLLLLFA